MVGGDDILRVETKKWCGWSAHFFASWGLCAKKLLTAFMSVRATKTRLKMHIGSLTKRCTRWSKNRTVVVRMVLQKGSGVCKRLLKQHIWSPPTQNFNFSLLMLLRYLFFCVYVNIYHLWLRDISVVCRQGIRNKLFPCFYVMKIIIILN